ncbi:MAG TPA: VanZ family protein [Bacteroidia bacterium]|nr:VanZ family protein [Bacteroidia bacterium]HNP97792.1 VanZ family protein [Bacteroidia bacterium]
MFLRNHLPTLVWAIFILIICGIPGDKIPELTFWQWLKPDKIVHLLIFGILCFLMIRSFKLQQSSSYLRNHAGILALLLSISYGILIEILQATVFIHRSGDVRDAIANSIGAFIGLWSFTKIAKRINFEK